MKITITDIMYINDAARVLKQRNIMWIQDKIFGIDNFNYIIYMPLDASKLSVFPSRGLIINQRDLSKFVKSISMESEFEFDENATSSSIVTISEVLMIQTSLQTESIILKNIKSINDINASICNIPEDDISSKLEQLYGMSKTSGAIQYKYDDSHIMTLFSGVIPLTKSDKLFIKLWDNSETTFLACFRVQKKQINVFVYLLYLKI